MPWNFRPRIVSVEAVEWYGLELLLRVVHNSFRYLALVQNNFIFMHDNTRPHIERVVQEYLAEVELLVLQ